MTENCNLEHLYCLVTYHWMSHCTSAQKADAFYILPIYMDQQKILRSKNISFLSRCPICLEEDWGDLDPTDVSMPAGSVNLNPLTSLSIGVTRAWHCQKYHFLIWRMNCQNLIVLVMVFSNNFLWGSSLRLFPLFHINYINSKPLCIGKLWNFDLWVSVC